MATHPLIGGHGVPIWVARRSRGPREPDPAAIDAQSVDSILHA